MIQQQTEIEFHIVRTLHPPILFLSFKVACNQKQGWNDDSIKWSSNSQSTRMSLFLSALVSNLPLNSKAIGHTSDFSSDVSFPRLAVMEADRLHRGTVRRSCNLIDRWMNLWCEAILDVGEDESAVRLTLIWRRRRRRDCNLLDRRIDLWAIRDGEEVCCDNGMAERFASENIIKEMKSKVVLSHKDSELKLCYVVNHVIVEIIPNLKP